VGASSSTPQVMAIQGGRVQKKPHGKAKGKGKAKGGQYSYPSRPRSLNHKKKSVWQKKDSVITARRGAGKLKHGSLYLYVGNGMRAEVEAIGRFDLHLP
nr:hypothetical protein [Tanacetum cinerariifolium]